MANETNGMSARLQEIYRACRAEINQQPLTAFYPLEKSQGRGMYNCPLCGSGTGRNHTGALRLYEPEGDRGSWHMICFANHCFGDRGTDTLGALRLLFPGESEWSLFQRFSLRALQQDAAPERKREPAEAPLARQLRQWEAQMSGSEAETYCTGRGFSPESIRRFHLGYDAAHFFPKLGRREPAVIIPYPGTAYYAARALREKVFDKPRSSEAGPEPLFNQAARAGAEPVFVVESQLCALSILQEGGQAVALGNTGKGRLMDAVRAHAPAGPLVLCLDNDPPSQPGLLEKGPRAQAELADALRAQGIPFLEINIAGDAKDPNEALQQDPEGFRRRLRQAREEALRWMARLQEEASAQEQEAIAQAELSQEARRLDYLQESTAGMMEDLVQEIGRNRTHPPLPTGFPALDRMLDGGLYPGLYILGAITSLGKTSFVLQVVDQLAAQGHDVLFFSLEMSRFELMAKSISRLTYQLVREQSLDQFRAKTTRGILAGKRYEKYLPTELETIAQARERYQAMGAHIWLIEGIGDVSVQQIRERVERHMAMTDRSPVVVVDYLQILTPVDIRATDKQNTDRNVLEMKRLSRDLAIPVLGISSLNRENYLQPINLTAFKEAGSIEYGSDCLIGLQYEGMDYREGEAEKAREKRVRDLFRENEGLARDGKGVSIELKILKNRNGARGVSAPLTYWPMYNLFEELPSGFTAYRGGDPFQGAATVKLREKG